MTCKIYGQLDKAFLYVGRKLGIEPTHIRLSREHFDMLKEELKLSTLYNGGEVDSYLGVNINIVDACHGVFSADTTRCDSFIEIGDPLCMDTKHAH